MLGPVFQVPTVQPSWGRLSLFFLVPLLFLFLLCFGFASVLLQFCFASFCCALLDRFGLLRFASFVLPQDKTMTTTMVDPETRRPETREWAVARRPAAATPCDPTRVQRRLPNAQRPTPNSLAREEARSRLTQLPTPTQSRDRLTVGVPQTTHHPPPPPTSPKLVHFPPYSRSAPRLLIPYHILSVSLTAPIPAPHIAHTHPYPSFKDGLDHGSGSYLKTLFWHHPASSASVIPSPLGLCHKPQAPPGAHIYLVFSPCMPDARFSNGSIPIPVASQPWMVQALELLGTHSIGNKVPRACPSIYPDSNAI